MAWLAYSQVALAMILVGANVAVGKVVVLDLPVFFFMAMRSLVAMGVLWPLARREGGPGLWHISRREKVELFFQAFLGMFLFNLFILYGVRLTSAATAGILMSTVPAAIAILAFVILKEQLGKWRTLAIGLAVLGVALVNAQAVSPEGAYPFALYGNLLILGAVVSEALFTILAKRLTRTISSVHLALGVNLVTLFLALPLALPEALALDYAAVPPHVWALAIYYALAASVFAFVLWYRGIAQVDASVAALFTGLLPLSAVVTAVVFLEETLTAWQIAGMALVLAAIGLGTLAHQPAKSAAPHEEAPRGS